VSQTPSTWKDDVLHCFATWDQRHVVTSPDVDGLLSAALVCQQFDAKVIGIYTTRHLVLFDHATHADAKDALWLDHDISHPGVICLGQHLIQRREDDQVVTRHRPTFNPNLHWGQSWDKSFKGRSGRGVDKYPFGTIHFLMAALEVDQFPVESAPRSLIAHADGSWVTPFDYPKNCAWWYKAMFASNDALIGDLVRLTYTTPATLNVHRHVVNDLLRKGVKRSRSRTGKGNTLPEGWDSIQGNQSISYGLNQDETTWLDKFVDVYSYIMELTGWTSPTPQTVRSITTGEYQRMYPNNVNNLDEWIVRERVFSHAFTAQSQLVYTTGLSLDEPS